MLGLVIRDLLASLRKRGVLLDHGCQEQAAVAVVLQTILRPSMERAVRSVFEQDLRARIHLLIGIDKRLGDGTLLRHTLADAPPNVAVTVFDPGYSTSVRHGGIHSNHFGGALRTILSFAANSPYVAYLDDDDWYEPSHLSSLVNVIRGHKWAHSLRSFVNPHNLEKMCIDTIENVGPNSGVYASWGGFACPSSLLIDKRACAPILHLWSEAGTPRGDAEDRVFFKALCRHSTSYGATGLATVNCVIKPEDGNHRIRENVIIAAGYPIERLRLSESHGFERA